MTKLSGQLSKMQVSLADDTQANYAMRLDEQLLPLNQTIGQPISLHYQGEIHCQACNRLTKKSFSGGFCFPCSQKLAQCDLCFMKPELCHYEQGTCRWPEWGEACLLYHSDAADTQVSETLLGSRSNRKTN